MSRSARTLLRFAAVVLAVGCTKAPADQPGEAQRPAQSAYVVPAPPTPTPAPVLFHVHRTPRKDLASDATRGEAQPQHGVALYVGGIAGEYILTVDFDTATTRSVFVDRSAAVPPVAKTATLTAAEVTAFRGASEAAWNLDPIPEPPTATDIQERLTIFDGDRVFHMVGHPIGGRDRYPNAIGELVTMVYATNRTGA